MKIAKSKIKNGFWKDERCEYCHGLILGKEVELLRKTKGSYVIFQHVPAGVCQDCGTRYYAVNTLKIISQKLQRQLKKTKRVALLDLAAA